MFWMTFRPLRRGVAAGLLVVVAACGGGGGGGGGGGASAGSGPTTVPPQQFAGRWSGTGKYTNQTSGSEQFSILTLADGTTWAIYSRQDDPAAIGGVAYGGGTFHTESYGYGPAVQSDFEHGFVHDEGQIFASVRPKESVRGSIAPCRSSICNVIVLGFDATYDPDGDRVANLSALAGTFTGNAYRSKVSEAATFRVTDIGSLSGVTASGCTYQGTVQARLDGNAYDVTVTSGGGSCGAQTVTGIAYMDSTTKTLTVASTVFAFRGAKP